MIRVCTGSLRTPLVPFCLQWDDRLDTEFSQRFSFNAKQEVAALAPPKGTSPVGDRLGTLSHHAQSGGQKTIFNSHDSDPALRPPLAFFIL
jgi:hypothetical protein